MEREMEEWERRCGGVTGRGYLAMEREDGRHTWEERRLLYIINWHTEERPHTCSNTHRAPSGITVFFQ